MAPWTQINIVCACSVMLQERAELREKSDVGVREDVAYYKKCMQQAARMKEDKAREKEDKAKRKQLSFKEKEKRKRDAGMQSSGEWLRESLCPGVPATVVICCYLSLATN